MPPSLSAGSGGVELLSGWAVLLLSYIVMGIHLLAQGVRRTRVTANHIMCCLIFMILNQRAGVEVVVVYLLSKVFPQLGSHWLLLLLR